MNVVEFVLVAGIARVDIVLERIFKDFRDLRAGRSQLAFHQFLDHEIAESAFVSGAGGS